MLDVTGRDGQVRVTELPADVVDRQRLAGELKRVRVAQPVRVHALVDPGLDRELLHQIPHVGVVYRLADRRLADHTEHRVAAVHAELPAIAQPPLEHRGGERVDPDRPRAIALPVKDRDRAALEIDVLRVERQHLRAAKPGAPHDRDHRPVAMPGRSAAARLEQRENFALRERLGGVPLALVRRRLASPIVGERHRGTVIAAPVALGIRNFGQRVTSVDRVAGIAPRHRGTARGDLAAPPYPITTARRRETAMPIFGASRPDRLRNIIGRLDEIAAMLLEEGFAWAPTELEGIADELRDHLAAIEPREQVTK